MVFLKPYRGHRFVGSLIPCAIAYHCRQQPATESEKTALTTIKGTLVANLDKSELNFIDTSAALAQSCRDWKPLKPSPRSKLPPWSH